MKRSILKRCQRSTGMASQFQSFLCTYMLQRAQDSSGLFSNAMFENAKQFIRPRNRLEDLGHRPRPLGKKKKIVMRVRWGIAKEREKDGWGDMEKKRETESEGDPHFLPRRRNMTLLSWIRSLRKRLSHE